MTTLIAHPIESDAFSAYGRLIDFKDAPDFWINDNTCERHHGLATVDVTGEQAEPIISLGRAKAFSLPLSLHMMERHPFGSQAFIPLQSSTMLIVVANDLNNTPVDLRAFMTTGSQGIQFHRNVWHGVLTPIGTGGDFIIVDRQGAGTNLEEHHFSDAIVIDKM